MKVLRPSRTGRGGVVVFSSSAGKKAQGNTTISNTAPRSSPILSRRHGLLYCVSSGLVLDLFGRQTASAVEEQEDGTKLDRYSDDLDGFSILVPAGWALGTGDLGQKKMDRFSNAAGMQRVVGFYPALNPDRASIAITVKTPGADYTGLGSFGSAIDFGEKLVVSMDRSYMTKGDPNMPVVTAKLISAKESSGKYVIEYETAKPGDATRRVWTSVCFGENPKGLRRFYTVTGSCTVEQTKQLGPMLLKAVDSFTP